jgi:hypothetical protein
VSESSVTVVDLDPSDDADGRVAELTSWLVAIGVAAANDDIDPLWSPSSLRPGPAWRTVVDHPDDALEGLANNGIDVRAGRDIHWPDENLEPPVCPHCQAPMDLDAYVALAERWLDEGEPTITCAACGLAQLLGDYLAPWGYAVGAPAVCFNNWPPLSETFLEEVRRRVGGRTFVVRAHW